MSRYKPTLEEKELLRLIKAGRLFEIQDWIQSGRTFPRSEAGEAFCPLTRTVESGFHSLLEVLLKAGDWSQDRLDQALQLAISNSRMDLADLLQAHGAAPSAIDFETICGTAEPEIMERYLRAGADPSFDNAFARALSEMKARPLLRFYRSLKDEFPALQAQAALALTEAVCQKSVRWVALLAWAGADPFMKVPQDLRGGWDNLEEDYSRTAAQEACWSGNDMLVKVLKLKPTPAQALDLLRDAACAHSSEVMREVFRCVGNISMNVGDPPSSEAVEYLVEYSSFSMYAYKAEAHEVEAAKCLEILLDRGAQWRPASEKLDGIRRSLVKQTPHYLVRILRLLLHTPGAADALQIRELCRTPKIRQKIAECDKFLLKDLDEIRAHGSS